METSPAQSNGGSSGTTLKRPRPVLSCLECRRKKLKCDRLLPCNQCQKSRLSCAYHDLPDTREPTTSVNGNFDESSRPQKRARFNPLESSSPQILNSSSAGGVANAPIGIIEDLQARVLALEQSRQAPSKSKIGEVEDRISTSIATEPYLPLSRARAHGKSLGLMANFDEARNFMQLLQRPSNDLEIQSISHQLKTLQNMVKAPKNETIRPSAQALEAEMFNLLPPKEICSQLLDIYFENFEHCLRILHRPSFLAEHDEFWNLRSGKRATTSLIHDTKPAFLPRLLASLLVVSSSSITPLCRTVTLAGRVERSAACDLLDKWLKSLKSRDRASLHALQVGALCTLIHHDRPPSVEETWITTGTLLRQAMAGGFHLEPEPKLGILEGEQRRRIWASLLEMELAASIMCGMPTTLTADEYTCRTPRNLNDAELSDHSTYLPTSLGTDIWTDSLCQFTLAISLRQRLQAYRLVTKASPEIEYDLIIAHARKLESVLQNLAAPLRFSSTSDDANNILGRSYARIHLDMAIRRTMIALYTPFAVLSIEQDPYKEARVGYVQSCLIIICYQDLFDPAFAESTQGAPDPATYWDLFYQDFKREILRSTLGVCLEIKWMRHMGFDRDPPGSTIANVDPTRYYDPTLPTRLWEIPAWTIEALIKAINDSLEPMIRRMGRSGSDLKDLGCMAIVFHSIKSDGDRLNRDIAMKTGLTELIAACQRILQQQKQSQSLHVSLNGKSTFQDDSQYLTPDFNFNFDDLLGTNITLDNNATMQLLHEDGDWPLNY